ncbi:MAG TPA: hypothetical protein VMT03_25130 [Polyangia bacterium]|nr:hypothetical protein [Polyangia bacterium]
MRTTWIALGTLVVVGAVGCTPDLSTICPSKPITQGVFGEVVDASGTLEENVQVDFYTEINGQQDSLVVSRQTTRGGYQIDVNPSTYIICVKATVCTMVTVPTGLVELTAVDTGDSATWNDPIAVPPAYTIGPCTWGN